MTLVFGSSLYLHGESHVVSRGEGGIRRVNGVCRVYVPGVDVEQEALALCRAEATPYLTGVQKATRARSSRIAALTSEAPVVRNLSASWCLVRGPKVTLNWRLVFMPPGAVQWLIAHTVVQAMPYTGPRTMLYGAPIPREFVARWRRRRLMDAGYSATYRDFERLAARAHGYFR